MANPEDADYTPCEKCGNEWAETLHQECGIVCEECYNAWKEPDMGTTYRVVRMYFEDHPRKVIVAGKTLEEVHRWCSDPDTSSSTTTSEAGKAHTEKYGAWFDGYEEE
jgi:hypothetical protein